MPAVLVLSSKNQPFDLRRERRSKLEKARALGVMSRHLREFFRMAGERDGRGVETPSPIAVGGTPEWKSPTTVPISTSQLESIACGYGK